ncbi:MAG: NADP-dependent oxidoreductase [Bryobacterales bacterium]|nr:NADP-dependent oxidoreductase [Bryobacterales bacterium]
MATENRRIVLAARPVGVPKLSDFRLERTPIPAPADGECLVRSHYLSVDPYMRGRISGRKSYAEPVAIGEVIVGAAVGEVLESHSDRIATGQFVMGALGWQEHACVPANALRVVDPNAAPLSAYLGVLGMPGLTAYYGLLRVAGVKAGETVCVSGAAGAVGSAVGQIARLHGCRAVGIAGGPRKCDWVSGELGFEAAVDYKGDGFRAALRAAVPDGIDVYFDNVGGPVTDAVFPRLNVRSRVAICGQISQYNAVDAPMGPRLLWHFIVKRIRAEGFLVFDFREHDRTALAQMTEWVRSGKLQYRETVAHGLENAPSAFVGMLGGANIGKQVVRLVA